MIHYNVWFSFNDGISERDGLARVRHFLAELHRRGQVADFRLMRNTREGNKTKLGPLQAQISFVDGAQFAAPFAEVAACLAPAPGPASQLAMAEFMREGHYLRHLRRTKRLYLEQQDALLGCLRKLGIAAEPAALALLVRLPKGLSDVAISREAFVHGLAPSPLSPWHAEAEDAPPGLLLSVATAPKEHVARACAQLAQLIERFSRADGEDAVA